MNVSPGEAEEALAAIQSMTRKTRHSIAASGAYISLIITGVVWLVGFMCTQFVPGEILPYIWGGISIAGGSLASFLGIRSSKRVRIPTATATAKRMGILWLLLAVYCLAAIAIAWPLDGKQLTIFTVLFVMIGWLAMGQLLSFSSIWPGLIIIALVLIGYFLLPGIFYLWMALLGGGGLIFLGLYIRLRW
jgi:hypothetical protein